MPKGVKVHEAPPPESATCDFCGEKFPPKKWNSRTCRACAERGAPDQGSTPNYERAIDRWLRKGGKRRVRSRSRRAG